MQIEIVDNATEFRVAFHICAMPDHIEHMKSSRYFVRPKAERKTVNRNISMWWFYFFNDMLSAHDNTDTNTIN